MNLASRFSLLALIALFSLITPKFATAQSYQLYQQCANGNVNVTLPNGTVIGHNTYCWYTVGPGNSNFWTPYFTPTPGGGSGGTTPPPPVPINNPNAPAVCVPSGADIQCSLGIYVHCSEFGQMDAIDAVMPTEQERDYKLTVNGPGGRTGWIVRWLSSGTVTVGRSLDECTGPAP